MNEIETAELLTAIEDFFNLKPTTNPMVIKALSGQLAKYKHTTAWNSFFEMTKTDKSARSVQQAFTTFREYYFKQKDSEAMKLKLEEDRVRLNYSAFEGERVKTCNVGKHSPEAEAFKLFNILAHFGYINAEMGKDSTFTHKECSKSVQAPLMAYLKGKTVCDLQEASKIVNKHLKKSVEEVEPKVTYTIEAEVKL